MDPRDLIAVAIALGAAAFLLRRALAPFRGKSTGGGCHSAKRPDPIEIELPKR